jgi:hypothetical protein
MAGPRGEARKAFEHASDVVVGEAIVAVAVCGVMPASCASSLAVSARPFISAVSMLARAGSPTSEAIMAMSGPDFILR